MSGGVFVIGDTFYMRKYVYGPVAADLGGVNRYKVVTMPFLSRQRQMPACCSPDVTHFGLKRKIK